MCQRFLAAAICWLFSAHVLAQAVPPTAEAGAIERQRERLPEPRVRQAIPGVVLAEPAPEAPPGAEEMVFTLRGLTVEGTEALPPDALLAPHLGLVGSTVSVARIYEIADAMTAAYRDAGYVLATVVVPAQAIEQGEVRLLAVEGYLSEVRFEGYTGSRDGLLAEVRAKLLSERPLRVATLERELLLLNDLPGMVAQGVLGRSPTEPGGAELTIRLARQAVGFDASASNRGTEVQGPRRFEVNASFNSLFGLFEETSFSFLTADPTSELKYGLISHTQRLTANGLDLRLYGSKSRSEPEVGVDFEDFNLETDTDQAGLELRYPVLRSRTRNLYLRGGLTYHDGLTDSSFPEEITRDTLAAVRLGLTFDSLDGLGGVNILDLEVSRGIDAFGASDKGDPLASRSGGRPDFTKTTLYLARLQSLGGGFSLLLAGTGQYAFNNLLAPEEFAFGGEFFGRAYDPSEIVGDSGAAGKVELRYTWDARGRGGLTFYTFYDTGRVWQRLGPEDFDVPEEDGASAYGGGLRFTVGASVTGYAEVAVPIDQIVLAEGNKDPRFFIGLRVMFGSKQTERY